MKWIFSKIPGDNSASGDDSSAALIKDKLKKFNIGELFLREAISNSFDAKNQQSSQPVKVFIDVIDLQGSPKKAFLEALDWKNLKPHVKGAIEDAQGELKSDLEQAHSVIEDHGRPLTIVRVSDYHTCGLQGPEDHKPALDNFYLFARALFMTKQEDNGRQGSFGLGKRVLYECSDLKTVIMSSCVIDPSDDTKKMTRTFGRSELNSHNCKQPGTQDWNPEQRWLGRGFFGVEGTYNNDLRAQSAWDESPDFLEKLLLNRNIISLQEEDQDVTGTSVLSLSFGEFGESENMINHMKAYVKKWFWPALTQSEKELRIFIRRFDNSNEMYSEELQIDENTDTNWLPFSKAMQEDNNATDLDESDNIINENIAWNIPSKRQSPKHDEFEANGVIKLIRSKLPNENQKNTIALLRNKLCVVNYLGFEAPENPAGSLFGVFLAGDALEEADKITHDFLRNSEPPLHDDWQYAEKIKDIYDFPGRTKRARTNNAQSLLRSIENSIKTSIQELISKNLKINKDNLSELSNFFNFGKGGKPMKEKDIHSKFIGMAVRDGHLVKRIIEISNLKKDLASDWIALVTAQVDGIGGLKNNSTITEIRPVEIDDEALTISEENKVWKIISSPETQKYKVEISVEHQSFFSVAQVQKLRTKYTISPGK